jgi:hypothetical protein
VPAPWRHGAGTAGGHLVSDFYGGYTHLPTPLQRCWVPRRRDRHELQERPEADLRVRQWAVPLEAGYRLAAQRLGQVPGLTGAHRQACYRRVGTRVAERGRQDAQVRTHPWQALATRRRQQDARCQVVLVDGRPAHTNATERRRRPVVVVHKRSGGTQRSAGRRTRLGVASRFAPWQARGLTPFTDCLHRLRQPPFPPICTLTPCSLGLCQSPWSIVGYPCT